MPFRFDRSVLELSLYRYSDLPYTAIHPVKQSGKTLLAGKATNTRLFSALAVTECAVPAGCSVGLFPVPTAGVLNVGTSCSRVLLNASITPRMAAPWAVRTGAVVAVP